MPSSAAALVKFMCLHAQRNVFALKFSIRSPPSREMRNEFYIYYFNEILCINQIFLYISGKYKSGAQ